MVNILSISDWMKRHCKKYCLNVSKYTRISQNTSYKDTSLNQNNYLWVAMRKKDHGNGYKQVQLERVDVAR